MSGWDQRYDFEFEDDITVEVPLLHVLCWVVLGALCWVPIVFVLWLVTR